MVILTITFISTAPPPGVPYGIPPLHVPGHPPAPFPGPVGPSFYHSGPMPPPPPMVEGIPHVPSVAELDHHYRILAEERKRLEDMLERTDRMMQGVKRGLDEMRAAGAPAPAPPPSQESSQPAQSGEGASASDAPAAAVPLARQEKGAREGAPVWHVAPPAAQGAPRE